MGSSKATFDRLYELAADQQGFFTTKQAIAAGYADNTHPFHVKSGNWIRDYRGIYHLPKYSLGEHPDMMLWYLWSRNRNEKPQGVYSHQTALNFYDISDINPSKLHMTVPPQFRRNSSIPKILILHRGIIHKDDLRQAQGFCVTQPLKTIVDLMGERSAQMDHMRQAVRQAFSRGLITQRQVENASRISDNIKKEIMQLKDWHG